jgi:hypothetical protein
MLDLHPGRQRCVGVAGPVGAVGECLADAAEVVGPKLWLIPKQPNPRARDDPGPHRYAPGFTGLKPGAYRSETRSA